MKSWYILAATHNWKGDESQEPLPITVPEEKLKEIDTIHPPFPRLSELTYNFLLFPGPPSKIHARISKWQALSRQLSAWIKKAKINSAQTTDCSWEWPTSPLFPGSLTENYVVHSTLTPVPDSPELSKVFVESAEPSCESDSAYSLSNGFITSSVRTACAFRAEVEWDILKRTRDFSLEDPSRDGSDSNNSSYGSRHSLASSSCVGP
ncbi:hypothetical protein JB92DRAFT_1589064 [Gautieria morchelliformis]|nr:hypothetical protein JB92DRAFT_1589064 [Gautieria morchelliformis]